MALYYIYKIHAKHWSQLWILFFVILCIINDNICSDQTLFFIMMWEDVLCFPVSGNYQKKKKNCGDHISMYIWRACISLRHTLNWNWMCGSWKRTYFAFKRNKARLLHRVFVLYIPARNVWKFPLYYISFPLSIVRLKRLKKNKNHC